MSYLEEDFADMLFVWPSVDGRITHLYELDPTHAPAEPSRIRLHKTGAVTTGSRSPVPFCVATDNAVTDVLLELDPTHFQAA